MQWLPQEQFGNGQDGSRIVSSNENELNFAYPCSGSVGAKILTASMGGNGGVGSIVTIYQTQGGTNGYWEFNVLASGTGGGTVNLKYPLSYNYGAGAQVRLTFQYSNYRINSSRTLTIPNWAGSTGGLYAAFINGTLYVDGYLTAVGKGFRGGSGRSGNPQNGARGESDIAGLYNDNSYIRNGNTGGGGGWSSTSSPYAGGGGGGGNITAGLFGINGQNPAQSGNANPYINSNLTFASFGGGGGSGGSVNNTVSGYGGYGGGGIILVARRIELTGTGIGADGLTGGNAPGDHDTGGGGGGAGGFILLKCQDAILGTNKLGAYRGPGGIQQIDNNRSGGNGSNGAIHIDYSGSISGSTIYPSFTATQDRQMADSFQGGII
jgi:large repetitive protein